MKKINHLTAEQLRKSILQLAIQGKLVSQKAEEGNARDLLAEIKNEKAKLIKEGKIKKEKPLPEITDKEKPFEIPENWCWCRLGDLGDFVRGAGIKRCDVVSSGFPCIRYGEMYTSYKTRFCQVKSFVNEEMYKKCFKIQKNDILMALTGENKQDIALAAVYEGEEKVAIGGDLCKFTPIKCNSLYLVYLINSPYGIDYKKESSTGDIIVHTSTSKLSNLFIPFPPLAEQKRIIEKIESLEPLLKEYEKCEKALTELDDNFTEKFKKSILQHAIEGKLVPQNPTDKPASELVNKIRAERAELIKQGKLKKDKNESYIYKGKDGLYYEKIGKAEPVALKDLPFEIPEGWCWYRLGDIVNIQTGASFKKDEAITENKPNYVRVLRGGNILPFNYLFKDDDLFVSNNLIDDNILLLKNDIITPAVTSLENIGKMAVIEDDLSMVTVGGFVYIFRPYISDKIISIIIMNFMYSKTFQYLMKSITKKSGQAFYNMSKEKLKALLFPLPPLAEQKRIVEKIEEIFRQLDNIKNPVE